MSRLNFGGCDHEYIGQPGCVCDPNPEIERLRDALDSKDKTVEELVRERYRVHAKWLKEYTMRTTYGDRIHGLRAERDRLRKAVHDALPFMAGACVDHPDAPNHQCAHTHRRTLAKLIGDQSPWVSLLTKETRAALGSTEEGER